MKSCVLPKFCVKVDWYPFFQFCLMFFSVLVEWRKNVILKKKKTYSYLLDKTDIFSQTSILSFEKWKKVTVFDFFA